METSQKESIKSGAGHLDLAHLKGGY
jgi:hypothetical protein